MFTPKTHVEISVSGVIADVKVVQIRNVCPINALLCISKIAAVYAMREIGNDVIVAKSGERTGQEGFIS
jgi:hypothetical protein